MKIAQPKDAVVVDAGRVLYGRPFYKCGDLYARLDPGIHGLDMEYAWAMKLESGLLTRFGLFEKVVEADGEFVPA